MHDLSSYIDFDKEVVLIDTETRTSSACPIQGDVTKSGTYRYAETAYPIVITWAHGLDGEVQTWETKDINRAPRHSEMPLDLIEAAGRGAKFCAFNSVFDRLIMKPYLNTVWDETRGTWNAHNNAYIRRWLDARVQAAYNNLPLGLDAAAQASNLEGKLASGSALIQKFCTYQGATPEEEPEAWAQFLDYAQVDIVRMQELLKATLPVPTSVWRDFWVSEEINDRGLPYAPLMAEGGSKIARELEASLSERLSEVTDGAVTGVRQYERQRAWVWDRVKGNPEVAHHMTIATRTDDDGVEQHVFKMDRPIITKMIAALMTQDEESGLTDDEYAALQLLELREHGASAAPFKFQKMQDLATGDRVKGQYIYFGATQTRRYASWGVQVHNMTRKTLGDLDEELAACTALEEGVSMRAFESRFGDVGKGLASLIRPTICAPEGRTLVWADSSNIEARGLPWLATTPGSMADLEDTPGSAEARLKMFREIDADPSNTPDVYIQSAAGMYGENAVELMRGHQNKDKHAGQLRQRGKIAELALGFNGGPGALQSMAANYGMAFKSEEAQEIVSRWRKANPWATKFWSDVEEAFMRAASNPSTGDVFSVGRLTYQGIDVGGEVWVLCYLPDGLPLIYRDVRERVDVTYDPFDKTVEISRERKLSFKSANGLKWAWPGILVENATQAACACILRDAISYARDMGAWVVGHTHDEILVECYDTEEAIEEAKLTLSTALLADPGWHPDLPLGVDVSENEWYSKAVEE